MGLTLEIEDGCKYNNLVNEIERDFLKYEIKAYDNYLRKNYEKSIQYYKICLRIDPDNKLIKEVYQTFEKIINNYIKKIIDCAYHSFYQEKYELSRYYFVKSQYLIEDNLKDITNINKSCLPHIKRYLDFIVKRLEDIKDIEDIDVLDFYSINIRI